MKFRKPKLGLGTRLALITGLIIAATLTVDVLSRVIVPQPDVILMDQQWLADNIAAAQAKLDGATPADRPAILDALPAHDILEFRIAPEREQFWHQEQPMQADALAAFLRPHLRPGSEIAVMVKDFSLSFEHALSSIAAVVAQMPVRARLMVTFCGSPVWKNVSPRRPQPPAQRLPLNSGRRYS